MVGQFLRSARTIGQTLIMWFSVLYMVGFFTWRLLILSPLYDQFWQLQFSEVIAVWSYLPLPFLIPLALVLRSPKALLALLIPFFLFANDYGRQFLPNWQLALQPVRDGSEIRVLTWNTFGSRNRDDSFTRVLKAHQPDLVAFQELAPGMRSQLMEQYGDEYPHQISGISASSMILLSKYPIRQSNADYMYLNICSCQLITIDMNGTPVTIINLHLPSPRRFVSGYGRLIPSVGAYSNKNQEAYHVVLQKLIDDVEGPLILLGDFNTTESQRAYRRLLEKLTDSFAEAGWGLGFTYPSPFIRRGFPRVFPLIRIDHVLHSKEWVTQEAWTASGETSDHQYVVADLALKE